MTITEPKIDKLLEQTDGDSFLLCGVVAKRAQDIQAMIHGQYTRANQAEVAPDVAHYYKQKALRIAFDEVANGDVSFVGHEGALKPVPVKDEAEEGTEEGSAEGEGAAEGADLVSADVDAIASEDSAE